MQTRLEELESVGRAAFDAVVALEEWLGGAGTRQAATDAWRRLEIKLMAAGFQPPIGKNLDFRGSILDDLERMGLRYDCRDDELRFFTPGEARCYASGPRLADFLAIARRGSEAGLTGRLTNPALQVPGEEGEPKHGTTSSDHDGEGSGART